MSGLFSAGSTSLTYHVAPSVLNVITTSRPFILSVVVFPKALFSALNASLCTLQLTVADLFPFDWSPPLGRHGVFPGKTVWSMPERFEIYIVYKRRYINTLPFLPFLLCKWYSALFLLPPTQLRLKHFSPSKRSSTYLLGLLLIFLLLNPLRLNSCSSDSKKQLAKIRNSFTWHLPLVVEILASSLTNIFPSLAKLHLSLQSTGGFKGRRGPAMAPPKKLSRSWLP